MNSMTKSRKICEEKWSCIVISWIKRNGKNTKAMAEDLDEAMRTLSQPLEQQMKRFAIQKIEHLQGTCAVSRNNTCAIL